MLDFQFIGDPQNAQAMSAYMRNQFPFIGLKSPQRKTQEKPLLQQAKAWDQSQLLDAFAELYAKPEREYQYAALALARKYATRFNFDGIQTLARYVTVKSWWDTVDNLRPIFWIYLQHHYEDMPKVWALFFGQDDFWLRRVAITLQLSAKSETDLHLLTQAIEYDLITDEFFIQKAIGWALRQYARGNAQWVKAFIHAHPELSKLAVREASKHL
ncbi:DNA alkylation repair protein [Lacticaseibacillus manihotivorans]|uniref:DNA alkylation repair enzyme n=2 Tax=Lacticaseibacillus manihotivorans TaxID=88233 RepID=A0A0R1QAX1_9LACO|nr:DNA alkylation repair protein [Lacticaseibacillus manihotivorans]KRL41577.1 DNA alkylation repair enzyme [Lacticaseibacillus manihotivorans DSM 13343 = JCM 12514]QFQ92799.1 6-O-methylguanine DNA methyltransferase [Lacticaseibacillus manihotivorans]